MANFDYSKTPDFYNSYEEINPALIIGLILISFGLYIINWIFIKNKEFEKLDKHAPSSNRGAVILMILPFFWIFLIIVLKKIFFSSDSLFIGILEIVGWGIILVLILKYLFDFCLSFGKITKTHGFTWFIFYFLGIIGVVLTSMGFYYFAILIPLLLLIVPAMQSELNSHFSRLSMKKKDNIFYS